MNLPPRSKRRISFLLHSLGLSCIGGAITLQILVFAEILQNGYFVAVENNPAILMVEVGLTVIALGYFIYIYQRMMRPSQKKSAN
jgi:hypothetical protein